MRTTIFLIIFLIYSCSTGTDTKKPPREDNAPGDAKAKIAFVEEEHDFGRVTEGEKVGWYFKYKNEGNADLIIKRASASCGCTVPEFDRKPLAPGEESSLKVIYDSSGRSGLEVKTVTIESNAENRIVKLKLKAEVLNK